MLVSVRMCFGDVESALECLVQQATGMAMLKREVVGLLQLAEDFRFAEHTWNRGRWRP